MKKFLHLVLISTLMSCGLILKAQESTPEIKVNRGENFELIKILNSYHWPYDISNNKKHVAIQGFGASDSYYWSEETGSVALSGYAFAVSDEGLMAGYYANDLGINVAGLWSPETKEWEFLGMNPDTPQFSTVEGDFEYNGAWAMTNDGSKIGIMQVYPDWTTSTYIWSKEEGYVKLPNGKSPGTRPNAMSDDGNTIAGLAVHEDKGEWTPCYWHNGEIFRIPHLFGEALNVSHNGKYICGYLLNGNAFQYDIENQKLVEIENILEPGNNLSASCITDNGIVLGYSDGGAPTFRKAFIYIGGELMYFNEYLKTNGIEEASNWIIYSINNITADGKTFIGAGLIDGEECSFVLNVDGAPCDGPTNLTYSIEQPNYNDIILKWDAPANATDDVTYEIYTSYSSAPFVNNITETTFTFEDMQAGEYQYFVRANYRNGECISEISNTVRPTVYPCAENEKCELTIIKADMYNDGWDNGYISIVGSLSDIVYTVKLSEGGDVNDPDTTTIQLCSDTYQFTWIPGNWDEEVGFSIIFQNEELYRVNIGDIDTIFKNKPMFFEYEINCENTDNIADLHAEENLNLYPNPANDHFIIEGKNIVNIEIFNAVGQKVEAIDVNNNYIEINTSKYENGIYFVKINTFNDRNEIKKLVVSK